MAEDTATATEQEQSTDKGAESNGDKPLGPAGEKALNEWKQRAKAAEKDAKRAADLEQELQQLREQSMSEQDKAITKARKEAADEVRKELEGKLAREQLQAKVVRAAAGKLADPEDAVRLLDFDELKDDDGAISSAIESLIEAKPYLAASATRHVSVDQGARNAPVAEGNDMNAMIRRAAGRA